MTDFEKDDFILWSDDDINPQGSPVVYHIGVTVGLR